VESHFQHHPTRDARVPFQTFFQARVELLDRDLGQKTEASQVDPQDRYFPAAEEPCHRDQRTVPPQHHNQFGLVANLPDSQRIRDAELACQLLIGHGGAAVLLQPGNQVAGDTEAAGVMDFGEYGDVLDLLHGSPTSVF